MKPSRKTTSTPKRAPKPPTKPAAKPKPKAAATPKPAPKTKATPAKPRAARKPKPAAPQERPLRILMVTSEAHPFAKTGGLAEVLGALPAALARLGHHVTVVLPRYRGVEAGGTRIEHPFALGPHTVPAAFIETSLADGVTAVLVDVPSLFDRDGIYGTHSRDFPDNALRFAVLSRGALEYARLKGERLSIIHAHDWQAGLVPVYQKMQFAQDPIVGGVPAVFTIHNLAFQGVFAPRELGTIGLGPEVLDMNALEYWGQISYLKGGINFSEKLTTVSPTYAREILTSEYGFGMEGALRRRAGDLVGIVNGIDTDRWNPANDEHVPVRYDATSLEKKRDAKRALLRAEGLGESEEVLRRPLIGVISRLTDQKGFDLMAAAAEELMALDATWVMLGSGEPHYEHMWRTFAARYPDRVTATIGFDENLAHQIEAGADMFLMPSRFEPCGLNQLYSLRYGTVPIVRGTGGLEDTVVDAAQPGGTGFKFSDYTPGALVAAVRRALDAFRDKDAWTALQREGMRRDASWDVSAREYVKVYREELHGI